MPRIEIGEVVQDTSGNALSGASCQINKRETGAATVYSAETGAGTLANPIITDSAGRIEGWLEGGSYDIVVTPPSGSVYTQRFEAVSGRNVPIDSGVALPTTPADGEVVYYQVAEGVTWAFKYNAGSASAYKWEFIGGPPLYAEVATLEGTASAPYVALATAGPAITLPLAGDYDIAIGAGIQNTAAAGGGNMSYDIGGAAATDTDAIVHFVAAGATSVNHNEMRLRRKTGLTAVTLTAKYGRTGAGTAEFRHRWIAATPARVTG